MRNSKKRDMVRTKLKTPQTYLPTIYVDCILEYSVIIVILHFFLKSDFNHPLYFVTPPPFFDDEGVVICSLNPKRERVRQPAGLGGR